VPGERDIGTHVQDMVEACERIIMFADGVSDVALLDQEAPVRGGVLYNLMILGEASKHVPEEWVARHSHIPWRRIAGMRDKIVHNYFGLNEDVVVLAVRTSVPAILPLLRTMLSEMDAGDQAEPTP
jgi:uncharacterized protein with HEPN domain